MTDDLAHRNKRLRDAVRQAAEKDATLKAAVFGIAVKQPTDAFN